MAGKKTAGENTKKAAGNAKKTEAAAAKQAVKDRASEAAEAAQWNKGAKDSSRADAAAAKKEEAERKRAEKAALQAEEEASLPSKGGKGNAKTAVKKTNRGLDLSQLDYVPAKAKQPFGAAPSGPARTISASGIDNALDALSLTSGNAAGDAGSIDRHPERRFKAAYNAFEERRLEEMKDDKTLRRQQKIDAIRKEFEKSPENPFNQVSGTYNSTRSELRDIAETERTKTEARLTGQQS